MVADAKFMDEFVAVGVNGKPVHPPSTPQSPAAATALTDRKGKENRSPWEWLAAFESNGILSCWRCSLHRGVYCTICHSKEKHHPLTCPMLATLNLKLIKVGGSLGGTGASSESPAGGPLASGTSGILGAKAAVGHPAAPSSDSPPATARMTVAVVAEGDKDSTDSFCWEGDEDSIMYVDALKPKALVSPFTSSSPGPSCCSLSMEPDPPGLTCLATQSVDDIVLPPTLVQLLLKAIPTTSNGTPSRLVVADTGVTDHMVPDSGAFISYKSVHGLQVRMGNNSFAPVLGCGTAIILLKSQRLLIQNVLHIPGLCVPLYSLCAHLCQVGCGFLGSYKTGMHVYFPGMVLMVNTSLDCHMSYKPLGKTASLSLLHVVQSWCPPAAYPTEQSAFLAQTRSQSCREQLGHSLGNGQPAVATYPSSSPDIAPPSPSDFSSEPHFPSSSPTLLSTLSWDDIARFVHRKGSSFLPVCPCDWANGSNTKTHWTSKEIHRALGCRHFQNYKHILLTSLYGQWINVDKFLLSLGSYSTIPKSARGGTIDCTKYSFLDVVYVDIAFGNCVLVGGFCYALILVD